MIIEFLSKIVKESNERGDNPFYVRSLLKEYFQILVLYFIYTHKEYKSELIFTGGTCLRHFYELQRLSENLDFDYQYNFSTEKFAKSVEEYFHKDLQFKNLNISLKQQGKQVLLKFPVLRELGLASESESNFLYIKCDIEKVPGKSFETIKSAKSAFGYNFVGLHYDLPSLFAGKITAVLKRNLFVGRDNKRTIKGRDFYDLLWYLKKGVKVNLELIREKFAEPDLNLADLQSRVDSKVYELSEYEIDFKNDLLPFISDNTFISDYVHNYIDEYKRYELKAV